MRPTHHPSAADGEPESGALRRIVAAVHRSRGIDMSHYKRAFLRRRLAVRLRARGVGDLDAYAALLESEPQEMGRLLRAMTINVSEFFRNPGLFRLLRVKVIPELLARARAEKRALQIWSAACASGDEVYSLAVLLERMGVEHRGAVLTGTDVDPEALAAARAGVFDEIRLREVETGVKDAFFEPGPRPRSYRILTDRLPTVRFRTHDLLAAPFRRNLDLILCRNVLIYFELELQERILGLLADALRPAGVLVLGRVERLSGAVRERFETIDLRERVYRKTIQGETHAG